MRIIVNYVLIVLAGMLITSCVTTQSVPIDQLEPGKVTLPSTIRKVALISRNFKFSIDTLSGYYNLDFRLKKAPKTDNGLIDSIAVTRSLDQLRKALLKSGRFDEVFVYPFSAIKPHSGDKELPFSSEYIRSICRESETDAVVSLEMLSFFYSRHNGSAGREIEGAANVKVTAIWSVYTPQGDGSIDRYTHSEVIKWNENQRNNNRSKVKLPDRRDAISTACGVAAKNYSKRIVPYWIESSRDIVGLDGSDWDKSMLYASKNKWEAAAQIWWKYTESAQKRVAGIAALDYAIAQEMLGDMEQASVWSDTAVKLLKSGENGRIARDYAATLYGRKLKAAELNSLLKVDHK